jgi:hypothetical protein
VNRVCIIVLYHPFSMSEDSYHPRMQVDFQKDLSGSDSYGLPVLQLKDTV